MDKPLIISHDIGTSGTKSVLIDIDGCIIDSQSAGYKTYFPQTGHAEQDPDDWWKGIISNTRAIMTRIGGDAGKKVAAMGVSGHMTGMVAVDREGNPVMNSIIHSDFRATKEHDRTCEILGEDNLYRMTGNIPSARSSLSKILWLKGNASELYGRTHKFFQSKDYINYKLTEDSFTCDLSDLTHGQMINIHKKNYDSNMLSELGLDEDKLPEIKKSTDIVGTLCRNAADLLGLPAGIPVVAGGGDGVCANVGAGIIHPGEAYLCLGTTAWIANITEEPYIDEDRRVFNHINADGESFGVCGTMSAAGRSITWVRDLFGVDNMKEFDQGAEQIGKGSEGLIFLPWLEGERSPINDINARGTYLGLTPVHGKNHLIRSTMEGAAYALRSILEVMSERGRITTLTAIGGGVNSSLWREIISEVLQIELIGTNIKADDATSVGAALIAGVGAGLYEDFDHALKIMKKERIQKKPEDEVPVYERLYKIYQQFYPALKSIFGQLSHWDAD